MSKFGFVNNKIIVESALRNLEQSFRRIQRPDQKVVGEWRSVAASRSGLFVQLKLYDEAMRISLARGTDSSVAEYAMYISHYMVMPTQPEELIVTKLVEDLLSRQGLEQDGYDKLNMPSGDLVFLNDEVPLILMALNRELRARHISTFPSDVGENMRLFGAQQIDLTEFVMRMLRRGYTVLDVTGVGATPPPASFFHYDAGRKRGIQILLSDATGAKVNIRA